MKTLLTLLLCLIAQAPIVAKDWSIDQLTLRALVQPDGTIEFRETRTYRFEGSYSRAEYEIRKQGFDRLYDIEVWMDGVQMTESDSKDPGTFRVRDRSSRVVIEWFYAAEDTSTVFEVRYNVAGAIVAGPEHSELFWTFIGTKWDRSTQASDIRVEFVNAERSATIPFWVEGGIDELLSESGENGKVEIGTGFVPRRDGLRIRMVFPTAWIPDAPITHFDFTLEQATADELRKDEQEVVDAQQDVAIAEFLNGLLPLLIFGPILTFGYFFHRYGRRFTPPVRIPEFGHTPPSDLPPAVVSWMVMSRMIVPQAMVATLLDLARRGYITMSSEDEPQHFGKPKTVTSVALTESSIQDADLQDYEITLCRHIESHTLDGPVRLPDLFPPNKSATTKWYAAWAAQAKANAEARGYMDKTSTKGVALSAIVCGVLLIASIFAAAYIGTLGVIGLVMSSIFLIASFFIYRRTETGEIIYRLWWAYRNGLKSGNKSDLADVTVGRHLVYAVAFGFAGKKLTNILDQMDVDPNSDQWLSVSGFMHNPALFSSQISGIVASASAGVTSTLQVPSG